MKVLAIREAAMNDATVEAMLRAGYPLELIISQLTKEKAHFLSQICHLSLIAPKKIRVGDKIMIYRAPANLIPDPE